MHGPLGAQFVVRKFLEIVRGKAGCDDFLKLLIACSIVCSAILSPHPNLCDSQSIPAEGEEEYVGAKIMSVGNILMPQLDHSAEIELPTFSPTELLGKTFITTDADGTEYKATVVKKIQNKQQTIRT